MTMVKNMVPGKLYQLHKDIDSGWTGPYEIFLFLRFAELTEDICEQISPDKLGYELLGRYGYEKVWDHDYTEYDEYDSIH